MNQLSPFLIEVHDKAFAHQGFVGNPLEVQVSLRWLDIGTARIVVASDHDTIPDLVARGSRVRISYDGEFLMSGKVVDRQVFDADDGRRVRFAVEDDVRLFWNTLAWPSPDAPVTAQQVTFDRVGNLETLVKSSLQTNVTRLGLPVTVAPQLDRGPTARAQWRFVPLIDPLLPLLTAAGIGLTVRHLPGTDRLTADITVGEQYDQTIEFGSGAIVTSDYSAQGPTATDVVLGDAGELASREFYSASSPDVIAAWGDRIEVFRDSAGANSDHLSAQRDLTSAQEEHDRAYTRWIEARVRVQEGAAGADADVAEALADVVASDVKINAANSLIAATFAAYQADLAARMAETLADGRPKAGVRIELVDTDQHRYGSPGLKVGDLVPIRLDAGLDVLERILQVDFGFTREQGLVVNPVVGEPTNDVLGQVFRAIKRLARANRQRAER